MVVDTGEEFGKHQYNIGIYYFYIHENPKGVVFRLKNRKNKLRQLIIDIIRFSAIKV
jgi:hypothetical protein